MYRVSWLQYRVSDLAVDTLEEAEEAISDLSPFNDYDIQIIEEIK